MICTEPGMTGGSTMSAVRRGRSIAGRSSRVNFRHPIETRTTRVELVRNLSSSVRLRATGHGWCAADNDDCVGRTDLAKTQCIDCNSGIIGRCHAEIYQGQLAQTTELLKLSDIGPSGLEHLEQAKKLCVKALRDLGLDPETAKAA